MKLTKTHKKYIKNNYKRMTVEEMSEALKVKPDDIKEFLLEKNKSVIEDNPKEETSKNIAIKGFNSIKEIIVANKILLGVILFFTALVYFNTSMNTFVSDDIPGFVNYAPIRDLVGSFKTLGTNNIIYSLSYYFFKTAPAPLHITSILIHMAVVITLFVFAYMAFNEKVALLAAALYAIHPANTEAINWISANGYLLTALAGLTICSLYTLYKKTKVRKYLLITIGMFCVFLITVRNPLFLTVPFIIAILDTFVLERKFDFKIIFKNALGYGWFFVAALIYFVVFLGKVTQTRLADLQSQYFLDPGSTEPFLIRAPYTLTKSAELLVFPKILTFYHEGDLVNLGLIWFVALILVCLTIYFLFKNKPLAGLMLILPISILPTFSPVQISWYVAERYLYMTNAFFCILLATLLLWIEKKTKLKNISIMLLVVILCAYSVRTIMRNNDWYNEKSLWIATAEASPNSPQAYNNLGDMYAKEKNWQKSAEMFAKAIELYPNYIAAYHNIGNTYLQMGNLEKAEENYKKAVSLRPTLYQSISNLGVIAYRKGQLAEAKKYFEEALKYNPDLQEAKNGLNAINEALQPTNVKTAESAAGK